MKALPTTAVLTCIFGILVPEIIGALDTGYSDTAQYLSELGATGAPYAFWANYVGFLPVGVLVACVCLLIPAVLSPSPTLIIASILLFGVSVGYLGAVVMPCDQGCAPSGDPTHQAMHNLFALFEYIGAILALFTFSWAFKTRSLNTLAAVTLAAAVLVVIGFVFMASPEAQASHGMWQRLADYSIFVWMLVVSIVLNTRLAESPNGAA